MRFLLRLAGYLLVAAGFVSLVIDGARSIANSGLLYTRLDQALATLVGLRGEALKPLVERALHPWLWDPVLVHLLQVPAALLALLLGFLLLKIGTPREPAIGIVTRR
ncbi:MAG: PetM family of cytochrome b6f complex subunit 7 [Bosea sp. (in: a-proteobacteria)]|uniref:PetM family of cytochrome b6f complex subunit 7 n=1 Tax=Bosea sp. (in: a-proteobacteria) TaxID=1871050 RepID=UPI0027323621|nr:PetM family of cytochrome b6f complex subunit 7 [Bosea sp. (in: a-proteobacteria)]MDP3321777.1 PetM family of cytochrome b6f complex subunit 7 [Bosea sp. (in: a-proteobacteria)]